jgi:hypothetical protein
MCVGAQTLTFSKRIHRPLVDLFTNHPLDTADQANNLFLVPFVVFRRRLKSFKKDSHLLVCDRVM